jgi:hypothetical protein
LRQIGLNLADKIDEGLHWYSERRQIVALGNGTENADNFVCFAVNDDSATRTRANTVAIRQIVIEGEQVRVRSAGEVSPELNEFVERTLEWVGINVNRLRDLKFVQAEENAVAMGEGVRQLEQREIARIGEAQERGIGQTNRRGTFIVGTRCKLSSDDFLAGNSVRIGH